MARDKSSEPMILADVVSQHAEVAAFPWLLREGVVNAPHCKLQEVVDFYVRVKAHIDGLRIAGEPGWGLWEEQLGHEEVEAFILSCIEKCWKEERAITVAGIDSSSRFGQLMPFDTAQGDRSTLRLGSG